tara:strand:- start:201 stop:467 length:267 start_codon:yes stop_codon:yes gene_type:complete
MRLLVDRYMFIGHVTGMVTSSADDRFGWVGTGICPVSLGDFVALASEDCLGFRAVSTNELNVVPLVLDLVRVPTDDKADAVREVFDVF